MVHPDPDLTATTAVERAQAVADDILFPAASEVDLSGRLPRGHLAALAGAGLFGLAAPLSPVDPSGVEIPQVHEALAGGCGATSFVWAQHHTPLRMIAASQNGALRDRWLGPMRSGDALGGVGFSHLRAGEHASVVATPNALGYSIEGTVPWLTSWGMADLFLLGARAPDATIVWAILIPGEAPLEAERLELCVLEATNTVRLRISGWQVGQDQLVSTEDAAAWRLRDSLATAGPSWGALGVARRCARLLSDIGGQAGEVGAAIEARVGTVHSHAAALARRRLEEAVESSVGPDNSPHPGPGPGPGPHPADDAGGVLAESAKLRASALLIAGDAASALVAASGGQAMAKDHPAQRLAREAAFYTIQAQTNRGRSATLAALGSRLGL